MGPPPPGYRPPGMPGALLLPVWFGFRICFVLGRAPAAAAACVALHCLWDFFVWLCVGHKRRLHASAPVCERQAQPGRRLSVCARIIGSRCSARLTRRAACSCRGSNASVLLLLRSAQHTTTPLSHCVSAAFSVLFLRSCMKTCAQAGLLAGRYSRLAAGRRPAGPRRPASRCSRSRPGRRLRQQQQQRRQQTRAGSSSSRATCAWCGQTRTSVWRSGRRCFPSTQQPGLAAQQQGHRL